MTNNTFINTIDTDNFSNICFFDNLSEQQNHILIYFALGAKLTEIASVMGTTDRKISYNLKAIAEELEINLSGLRLVIVARMLMIKLR